MGKDKNFDLFGYPFPSFTTMAPEDIVSITYAKSADDKKPEDPGLYIPLLPSRPEILHPGVPTRATDIVTTNYRQDRQTSVIGRDIATEELRPLSDINRRSGLYILGISGMGKSWLLINLMLQDIKRGHGLVFIDPHGSAIDDLLERACLETESRFKDCLLFNPEEESRSFGINLLRCENTASLNARQDTYTRAKGVFDKIWKSAYYEVPWLQEVLQYTLYAFIENQDYTLADVPQFLTHREFREYVAGNIRYNRQAADFWRRRFEPKRAAAALTRVDALLGDPYVHDIVAQTETTINFTKFIEEKRIVLFRLSDRLSTDVKTFIGTILISELVDAVKRRSTKNPDQFSVYVDEFQNFVSYEDFSTLITGGRKYGVATTIAHQERYGQFGEDRRILGATDAAGNKICFQLSARDAKECAVLFAEEPPMETKREEQLVITPHPVDHLLSRGHKDPAIREFVNKYLRSMQYKREDTKETMEEERLKRLMHLDQAGIYAADERIETLETNDDLVRGVYLDARRRELVRAQAQVGVLLNLFNLSKNLRLTMRGLNSFLNAIMEGRINCGEEPFSDFLISLVRGYSGIDAKHLEALVLYIALSYGDKKQQRVVPFELAEASGFWLFWIDVAVMKPRLEARIRWENLTKEQAIHDARVLQSLSLPHTYKGKEGTGIKPLWNGWEGVIQEDYRIEREAKDPNIAGRLEEQIIVRQDCRLYKWSAYALCVDYCLYHIYPPLQDLLKPYLGTRFNRYEDGEPVRIHIPDIDETVALIGHADVSWQIQPGLTGEMMAAECVRFLRWYGEGAFVVFALIALARYIYQDIKEKRPGRRGYLPLHLEIAGVDEDEVRALVNEMANVIVSMPEYLSAQVLSDGETRRLRSACLQQLRQADEKTRGAAATIDEFVSFCARLSEADNHIQVPSGQYTVKQVPARFEHDMVNENIRKLLELPKYTAYAKILQQTDGAQSVWKGKIQTLKLPPGPEDLLTRALVSCRRSLIDSQTREYLKWRYRIAEEITSRQKSWRAKAVGEPPEVRAESRMETVDVGKVELPIWLRHIPSATITKVKTAEAEPEDEPPPSHS